MNTGKNNIYVYPEEATADIIADIFAKGENISYRDIIDSVKAKHGIVVDSAWVHDCLYKYMDENNLLD